MQEDEKKKLLQEFFDYQYKRYEGVISALVSLKVTTEAIYGINLPDGWGEKVLSEVAKLEFDTKGENATNI